MGKKKKLVAASLLVGAAVAGGVALSNKKNRQRLLKAAKKVRSKGGRAFSEVQKRVPGVVKLAKTQIKKVQKRFPVGKLTKKSSKKK